MYQYEWYFILCFLSSSFPPSITIPHLSHSTCLGGSVSLVVQDHIYEIRPGTNTTRDSIDHQDLSNDDTSFFETPMSYTNTILARFGSAKSELEMPSLWMVNLFM